MQWRRAAQLQLQRVPGVHSRLHGLRERVQEVLNLVRLFAQLVERAGVVGGAVAASSITEGALVSQMVAGGAADLRHGV